MAYLTNIHTIKNCGYKSEVSLMLCELRADKETMACTNGRINPDQQTKLRLFSDAAGYCNRPTCRKRLFSDEGGADYHIGEMAHIIAAMDEGPRADANVAPEQRADYGNLILLCPSCHTEIDKSPETFPVGTIREWKSDHKKKISQAIGVVRMESRPDARQHVSRLLRTNKMIFDKFGPNNAYHENPEAEEARVWQRKMLSQIIPNNQELLLFLDANHHLLNDGELRTLEDFRQHVDDLIERHLGDDKEVASRFPAAMERILEDAA
jgi:hypothetical protein